MSCVGTKGRDIGCFRGRMPRDAEWIELRSVAIFGRKNCHSHPSDKNKVVARMGHPEGCFGREEGQEQRQRQQQIPFGNDKQKSKSKSKGNGKG